VKKITIYQIKTNYPLKVCEEDSYISDLNLFQDSYISDLRSVCFVSASVCGLSLCVVNHVCVWSESGSIMSVC
jgi:hypothetical protein